MLKTLTYITDETGGYFKDTITEFEEVESRYVCMKCGEQINPKEFFKGYKEIKEESKKC